MKHCAVLVLGYARPEFVLRRLQEIVQVNTGELQIIVSIDKYEGLEHSRVTNEFRSLQERFQEYQWITNEQRFGLVRHLTTRIKDVFENYENLIIIEDDVSVSSEAVMDLASAVASAEGKDFFTTGLFGAFPNPGLGKVAKNSWRRTPYFSAWGWAMNKKFWDIYDTEIVKNLGVQALRGRRGWERLNSHQKKRWAFRFSRVESDPNYTWDYQMQFLTWLYELEHKLPIWRLCDNEGFGDPRATNTRLRRPNWYVGTKATSRMRSDFAQPFHSADKFIRNVDSYTWIGDRLLFERMRNR